jgi:hypothetical protein
VLLGYKAGTVENTVPAIEGPRITLGGAFYVLFQVLVVVYGLLFLPFVLVAGWSN